MLDRIRGGLALTSLDALLGIATRVPAQVVHPVAAFPSDVLFGATFLSAIASTTVFVAVQPAVGERHRRVCDDLHVRADRGAVRDRLGAE